LGICVADLVDRIAADRLAAANCVGVALRGMDARGMLEGASHGDCRVESFDAVCPRRTIVARLPVELLMPSDSVFVAAGGPPLLEGSSHDGSRRGARPWIGRVVQMAQPEQVLPFIRPTI
jgi:hypothetical protein